MNFIWWMIAGYVRVRVVSAQPEHLLGSLSSRMQIRDITHPTALSIECSLARWKLPEFESEIEKDGAQWELIGSYGFPQACKRAWKAPVIVCFVAMLLASSIVIPGRVFFIQVQGNEEVSDRQILNAVSEVGLSFGARRRQLRSEQIKNQLLTAIPSLSWVGVNTQGCVATISVHERKIEPDEHEETPGHIVASRDAVVQSFTVTRGKAMCKNGQAVHAGEVLISGYMDMGICTRVEQAEGEVYGVTRRDICAVLPDKTQYFQSNRGETKKYSILVGKKRINLYSDSGILYPTCGKMAKVKTMTLPGGWKLPVSLVIESYTQRSGTLTQRPEDQAQQMLLDCVRRQTMQSLVAGQIISQDLELSQDPGAYTMTGTLECHEMIGKRSSGVFIEGDTSDDGKNS